MPQTTRRKLLVLPNDPLYRYRDKGEVKERYFNPENFFHEVHFLSLCDEDDALEEARVMAGAAEAVIHPVGRPGPLSMNGVIRRVREVASRVSPQAVRGYNPLFMGWLAVKLARQTGAASVVSVHADYSMWRSLKINGPGYLCGTKGVYHLVHNLLRLNRVSLGQADHVISAYGFPLGYIRNWRRSGTSVVYNRVDLDRFRPADDHTPETDGLRVICVGRQFPGKDPSPLVESLAHADKVSLTLVGTGPYHERLRRLCEQRCLRERVEFVERVENEKLPGLYRRHDAFAINIQYPGICIPVLEAAASGLPVVINRPLWEKTPELVGGLAEVVEPTAAGYRRAFARLRDDIGYRRQRGMALRELVMDYDGRKMESREREIYEKLIAHNSSC